MHKWMFVCAGVQLRKTIPNLNQVLGYANSINIFTLCILRHQVVPKKSSIKNEILAASDDLTCELRTFLKKI